LEATLAQGAPPRRNVRGNAHPLSGRPGTRAQTFATPVSPAGHHGELLQTKASTSETSRALQALTRSKQPHLRCLPSFFCVSRGRAVATPRRWTALLAASAAT